MEQRRWGRLPVLAAVVLFSACEQAEQLQDSFRDLTPRETYEAVLADAGLAETALARDWTAAGRDALESPTPVTLPFQESGHIAPEVPGAVAYRLSIPRGRKLTFHVSLDSNEGTRLFIDLFRVPQDERDPLRSVISSDSLSHTFVHEPWRGGDFVLRVQPELLRGGRYRITVSEEAQLGLPVEGYGMRAILSPFGVPRDGGRRVHHGVDIFAPRGTPVLASAAGIIRRVRVTNRGGKVVWLRDPVHDVSIYYAHLDSQNVRDGQRVERGDTVGFVGNTGNARTTPPHLHFGLYQRGPIDPYPFIDPPRRALPEMTADLTLLGDRVNPGNDGVRLRVAPGLRGSVITELDAATPLRVMGASGDWFRVRLPDGTNGYVAARLMQPLGELADEDGDAGGG